MMASEILGRGVYSVPEAAAYTGLAASTVSRWTFGYRTYPGIIEPGLPSLGTTRAISFLTLMELYLMKRLKDHGLPAEKLRVAAGEVARREGITHPYAFERLSDFLKHDNSDFYYRVGNDWEQITGRHRDHMVWDLVVEPYLHEVEFDDSYARRWFPSASGGLVVLDPAVKFGDPVIAGTRIPTANILDQLEAGDSESVVANYYDLTVEQVQAARGFELRTRQAA